MKNPGYDSRYYRGVEDFLDAKERFSILFVVRSDVR